MGREVGGEGKREKRKGEEKRGRRGRWEGERRSCPVIAFDARFGGQKASWFQLSLNYISCRRSALAKMSVFCASQTPGSCASDLCHPVCQQQEQTDALCPLPASDPGSASNPNPTEPKWGGSVKELLLLQEVQESLREGAGNGC